MNHQSLLYILIDDDETNNLLSEFAIRDIEPLANIYSFTDSEVGLEQLTTLIYLNYRCLLLLDINMPMLSGWDILDSLSHLPAKHAGNLTIGMLSSSVNQDDRARALEHPLVTQYIEKPLTTNGIQELINRMATKAA